MKKYAEKYRDLGTQNAVQCKKKELIGMTKSSPIHVFKHFQMKKSNINAKHFLD